MKIGLDIFLEDDYKKFVGNRIGLVTNLTGVNQRLIPTIDLFQEHDDIQLTALYAPEHGIRGEAKAGAKVDTFIDEQTGLPVYSLYGETRKPTKEMLDNVDVIVFDLQDIGSRYYTYIYTMAYVMEACAEHRKAFVVLDRPNPISGLQMEGNLVEEDVRSFVGLFPIPNRHGMTVGELALLFKHEFNFNCDLTIVPMAGWKRGMYFDETGLFWVPPSPNATNLSMNVLYTGTCLVEGTNLSEGRGTTRPFEWIGAPFIDGNKLAKTFNEQRMAGVLARPVTFQPTYQKFANELCHGVQLHVERKEKLHSLKMGIVLLEKIAALYPHEFSFIEHESDRNFFDLLAGTQKLRNNIWNEETEQFMEECEQQLNRFDKIKRDYLLYK